MFHATIATVVWVTLLTLCAGALAQDPAPAEDPLLAPEGKCAFDDEPDAHHRDQRLAMHCLVAYIRTASDLPPLRSSEQLRHSATYKARRIAACKTFTHHPCGDKLDVPFQQAQLTRLGKWVVGEDLAWGVDADATPRAIIRRWLRSPTHRRVLLTKEFSHLGIRRRRLQMKGAPAGSVLWVAHVGRPARG